MGKKRVTRKKQVRRTNPETGQVETVFEDVTEWVSDSSDSPSGDCGGE